MILAKFGVGVAALMVAVALFTGGTAHAWTEEDCKEVNYQHEDCGGYEQPTPSRTPTQPRGDDEPERTPTPERDDDITVCIDGATITIKRGSIPPSQYIRGRCPRPTPTPTTVSTPRPPPVLLPDVTPVPTFTPVASSVPPRVAATPPPVVVTPVAPVAPRVVPLPAKTGSCGPGCNP